MFVARNHRHSTAPAVEAALSAAVADVRSDGAKNDWVLCGFQGGDGIRLIGTGTGGIEVRDRIISRVCTAAVVAVLRLLLSHSVPD